MADFMKVHISSKAYKTNSFMNELNNSNSTAKPMFLKSSNTTEKLRIIYFQIGSGE